MLNNGVQVASVSALRRLLHKFLAKKGKGTTTTFIKPGQKRELTASPDKRLRSQFPFLPSVGAGSFLCGNSVGLIYDSHDFVIMPNSHWQKIKEIICILII